MTMLLVFNDEPVRENHISWITQEQSGKTTLVEVVQACYRHPEAPDHMLVPVIEFRNHESYEDSPTNRLKYPHIFMLKDNISNVTNIKK